MSALPVDLDPDDLDVLDLPQSQIRRNQETGRIEIPSKYTELFLDNSTTNDRDDDSESRDDSCSSDTDNGDHPCDNGDHPCDNDYIGSDSESSTSSGSSTGSISTSSVQTFGVEEWPQVRAMYIASFWLDRWYEDGLPTPKTTFYDLTRVQGDPSIVPWPSQGSAASATGSQGHAPFVRLTSLSSKTSSRPQPYASIQEALEDIGSSARCQRSLEIDLLAHAGQPTMQLAVREWVDLNRGKEYRCVIFEEAIRKIVPNDATRQPPVADPRELLQRCQRLLYEMFHCLPCVDCVMDVWITDAEGDDTNNASCGTSSGSATSGAPVVHDLVIEFNSFGTIGNSASDDIDWTDSTLYLPSFYAPVVLL
jgi:hypothetical protein